MNIPLSCIEEEYINTIALINNKLPTKTSNSLLVAYQQYAIKVYSKSKQYRQFKDQNILRLEIAYLRKVKLTKELGKLSSLDDLLNPHLWKCMANILMNLVSQILFFDYSEINLKDLTTKESFIFLEWSNPVRLCQESDKSKKSRFKKLAIAIYQKYSENRKANELKEKTSKQLKMMLDYRYTLATN